MLKNYLSIAMRSIMRNKLFTVINVIGLSIGIGVAVMIFLYVEYERGFDRFHQKADRIYRVVQESVNAEGTDQDGSVPFPVGAALRADYPGIELTRYFNDAVQDVVAEGKVFQLNNILYVDSLFFDIFDYQWYKGSPESCLREPSSVVLTKSTAIKLFGSIDPIGKVIKLEKNRYVTVTGILEDPPKQSSNPFSIIIPIRFLNREYMGFEYDSFSTTLSGFECCILLRENESTAETDYRLAQVQAKNKDNGAHDNRRYFLMPLSSTHFEPEYSSISGIYSTSRMTLRVYILIGILILGVGIVNFVNLATAQAMRRSREVGIRKAVGALKGNIFRQFILETSVITLMAVIGGLILAEVFLPNLSTFLGINSTLSLYNSRFAIVFIPLLIFVVVILTGFYPAMILSGFDPIKALKGKSYGRRKGLVSLNSSLVVFQFVISIVLIISTVVIARQMNYIRSKDLGFAREGRMMIGLPSRSEDKLDALRNDLMGNTVVISVSYGIGGPASGRNMTTNFQMPGQKHEEEMRINLKPCDSNYLKTTGLRLIAGEWFKEEIKKATTDSVDKRPNHMRVKSEDDFWGVVVNRKTTEMMGCKDPADAVRQKILISGNDATVVGVIEDFNLYSLHDPMMATAFYHEPKRFVTAIIQYVDNQESKVIALAESYWRRYFPDTYFSAHTYKDELSDYYESDARTLGLVKFFSVIAILIGCMGLFGLVSFMVVQRTKEIGIRKVLGASVSTITSMLLRTFLIWIGIANLIAWPLAWYTMNRWLQNFAYHIEFEFWIFGIAAIASLLVGSLTVAWHAVRSAMTDPVEAIRYE